MQGVRNFINLFSPITEAAWGELVLIMKPQQFGKGELLTDSHRVCNKLYFLESGLIKLYFINADGKNIILRFFKENSVFTSLESFLTERPTAHMIKALEQTSVFTVEKTQFQQLCDQHPSLFGFYQKLLEQININMLQRITELLKDDAKMRYNLFIQSNPTIAQRISLGDMADYLGITQVSLSRVRAQK
ncbi:MAG: Crp/Fnr family transcriptional regulator [Marinoscillum sp.]